MRREHVLVLGGTAEARAVAERYRAEGHEVVYSLAGVTRAPKLPDVAIRRGGFGGAQGLADYLKTERITLLVDATHPYATAISAHAVQAAEIAGVRLERIGREAWVPEAGWIVTSDAVAALPQDACVLLTIGRKGIAPFLHLRGVVRCIEVPDLKLPERWTLLLARPPFTLEDEVALMRRHGITHLVTKNSGGEAAKLEAAKALGVQVVMIARPVSAGSG